MFSSLKKMFSGGEKEREKLLDTVNLKGEHYTSYKKQGEHVKAGELLVEFDIDAIKEAGYDVITPIIVCNTPNYPDMVCHTGMQVKELDPIIEL